MTTLQATPQSAAAQQPYGPPPPPPTGAPQQGPSVAEMVRDEHKRQEKADQRKQNASESQQNILSQKSDVDTNGDGIISLAEAQNAKSKDASTDIRSLINRVLELNHQLEKQQKQFHGVDQNGNVVGKDLGMQNQMLPAFARTNQLA